MPTSDIQLQSVIRQVLTGCWVDTAAIQIRVTNGKVYLAGTIQPVTRNQRDLQPQQLQLLDANLRKLRGVRDIKYNFSNWEAGLRGNWQPKGKKR